MKVISVLLAIIWLSACAVDVNRIQDSLGAEEMEMNLTSNQENTDFYGKSLNGKAIRAKYALELPPRNGNIHLGRGKFVNIQISKNGVYEILAKPPGYIDKNVTIAPPISSRMSFVFEISEKTNDNPISPTPETTLVALAKRSETDNSTNHQRPHNKAAITPALTITANTKQARTALVIGNSAYQFTPTLKNPTNDASDMGASLKKLGFSVTTLLNASRKEMEEAIGDLGRRLVGGGVGLFFYAGHGLQINGENYLLPVDADIKSETDVRYKAVNAGQVLGEMGEARNGMNIVILDACRDNPLPRSYRSSKSGLAEMEAPKGSIIAFATAPGNTASDGTGRNGIYTKHILENIETPDLPVEVMFKKVLQGVNSSTSGNQIPWTSSSFTGDFYFKLSE